MGFQNFPQHPDMGNPLLAGLLPYPRLIYLMVRVLNTPHFFQKDREGFTCGNHLFDMPLLQFTGFFDILVDNQFSGAVIFPQALRNQERRLGKISWKIDLDVVVQFLR